MQAHGHDAHGGGHGGHAAHGAAADPDFAPWLGATLLFLAALAATFLLPARHVAGPALAPRPAAGAHGGAHGAAHGDAPAHAGPQAAPGDEARVRDERARIAEVFGAMAGYGLADDSVPPEVKLEIEHMIGLVASSDAAFTLELEPRTPGEAAQYLLERWRRLEGEIYSGEAFLARALGRKLIDDKVNRVRFPDGTDRPLRAWLQERLDAFRAAGGK